MIGEALDQMHVWFLSQPEPVMMVLLGVYSLPVLALGALSFIVLPGQARNPDRWSLAGRMLRSRSATAMLLVLVLLVGFAYAFLGVHFVAWQHSEEFHAAYEAATMTIQRNELIGGVPLATAGFAGYVAFRLFPLCIRGAPHE